MYSGVVTFNQLHGVVGFGESCSIKGVQLLIIFYFNVEPVFDVYFVLWKLVHLFVGFPLSLTLMLFPSFIEENGIFLISRSGWD